MSPGGSGNDTPDMSAELITSSALDSAAGNHQTDAGTYTAMSGGGSTDALTGGAGADRSTTTQSATAWTRPLVSRRVGRRLDIRHVMGYDSATSDIETWSRSRARTTVVVNADGVGSDFVSLSMLRGR